MENQENITNNPKKLENWENIHPDFDKEIYSDSESYSEDDSVNKTYQQQWEEEGIKYNEAQEWIKIGLKPENIKKVQEWKKHDFTPQETHEWIELGFNSDYYNADKARSWKDRGFDYQQTKDWIQSDWELEDSEKAKEWKDRDFTAQKSQEWMKMGFKTYEYQKAKEWNVRGFAPQQVQGWIRSGLSKNYGAKFAKFLLKEGYTLESFPNDIQLEKLKEDYAYSSSDWSVIDESFFEYQKKWEENGFILKEVKEWINIGFVPCEDLEARKWKKKGFAPEETKFWLNFGLDKNDFGLADWLVKEKKYNPEKGKKKAIEKLKNLYLSSWKDINKDFEDYNYRNQWEECDFTAQETKEWIEVNLKNDEAEFALYLKKRGYILSAINKQKLRNENWLEWKYPLEKRKEIKELNLRNSRLEGSLDLSDFVNLENLDCYENLEITSLNLGDCEELADLDCSWNKLTNKSLILPKEGKKLAKISTGNYLSFGYKHSNWLTDLSIFSHLENLEELDLSYNPLIVGSLEPLSNCKKLNYLNIQNTGIDFGLEYLPESLESFEFKNTKLEEILGSSWWNSENIRKWKNELSKKQTATRLIFKFWKKQKISQQLKIERELQTKIQARELLKDEFQEKSKRIQEQELLIESLKFRLFSFQNQDQSQQWIQAGFTNNDSALITFLQAHDYQSPQQALSEVKNITELRNKHQNYLEYKNQIEVILKPN